MLSSEEIDALAPDQRKAYFAPSQIAAPLFLEAPAVSKDWHKRIISGIVNVAPGETMEQRMHTIRALILSMQNNLLAEQRKECEQMIMQADGFALLLIPKQLLDQINATQNHQGD
jgi:hypothetical protein